MLESQQIMIDTQRRTIDLQAHNEMRADAVAASIRKGDNNKELYALMRQDKLLT